MDYDSIDALAAVLRDRALTTVAIAKIFRCTRIVATERLNKLRERGVKLVETKVREKQTGPMSTAYQVKR